MECLNKDGLFGGFNYCLLINYSDEHAALSLHADDEHEQLDLSHRIAIIHIDRSRDLEFYPKSYLKLYKHMKQATIKTVCKEHGSLTILNPGCQEALCHRVAKSSDKKKAVELYLLGKSQLKGLQQKAAFILLAIFSP